MIGLDTNVLVRYIMQDDAKQAAMATRLIESLTTDHPGYITQVSIIELCWVLSGAYGLDRAQLFLAIETLLRTDALIVDQAEIVWKALKVFQVGKADFADCLIERSCASADCSQTMTFDRAAVNGCAMVLVK